MAEENHIAIIGTLGVLINGKKQGLIDSVKVKMDELRQIGFWISDDLYDDVIEIEKRL